MKHHLKSELDNCCQGPFEKEIILKSNSDSPIIEALIHSLFTYSRPKYVLTEILMDEEN